MTLTFFGRSVSPGSTAGKLVLFVAFPLIALLMGYSCYLGTVAIGAVAHMHPLLVFLVLFALMLELTFNGRKVGLLPGKHTRAFLGWACFAVSLYYYVSHDMRFQVIVVSASVLCTQVGRFVKLIQDNREEQWQLKRAMQTEMVDLKYGNRSDK